MSKHTKWHILGVVMAILLWTGCKEETHSPIKKGGDAPGQVKNVNSTPTPGGAELVYSLPDDADLLYVEAIVNTPEGHQLKFKSSAQKAQINIEGLATDKEQEVLLYSVNTGEVRSEPVSVKINPLTPPYRAVFQTMEMVEGLGGVTLAFQNETAADLAFYLVRKENGVYKEKAAQYTAKVDGRILFWGYPDEEQDFGIYIRDRWDHYSDTLYATLTPIKEIMLDKEKFKGYMLQNDGKIVVADNVKIEYLWDGLFSQNFNDPYMDNGLDYHNFTVEGTEKEPGAFTIDLGTKAHISRIRVSHYHPFINSAPKLYEVYVLENYYDTNISPNMGAWHNWTKIVDAENVRPSDKGGDVSEDAESWEEGDILMLNPPTDPVRYIRFKSVESWDGKANFSAAEITVYGQNVEE